MWEHSNALRCSPPSDPLAGVTTGTAAAAGDGDGDIRDEDDEGGDAGCKTRAAVYWGTTCVHTVLLPRRSSRNPHESHTSVFLPLLLF